MPVFHTQADTVALGILGAFGDIRGGSLYGIIALTADLDGLCPQEVGIAQQGAKPLPISNISGVGDQRDGLAVVNQKITHGLDGVSVHFPQECAFQNIRKLHIGAAGAVAQSQLLLKARCQKIRRCDAEFIHSLQFLSPRVGQITQISQVGSVQ